MHDCDLRTKAGCTAVAFFVLLFMVYKIYTYVDVKQYLLIVIIDACYGS